MEVHSTRFGRIEFAGDDAVSFPEGLFGFPDARQWVLLADPENEALAWLQSTTRPELAVAVVSPRRFVPRYQLRVCRRELEPLGIEDLGSACVLAVISRSEGGLSLNLQAPLVLDVDRRVGRQVIANGNVPLRHFLTPPAALRKSA